MSVLPYFPSTLFKLCTLSLMFGLSGCQTSPEIPITQASTSAGIAQSVVVSNPPTALKIVFPEANLPPDSTLVQVPENNRFVIQLMAEDVPGSDLHYKLQDGMDLEHFSLDEQTGMLSLKEIPDWENPQDADKNNNYMVLWQVVSSSGQARSQFLIVQIVDLPG